MKNTMLEKYYKEVEAVFWLLIEPLKCQNTPYAESSVRALEAAREGTRVAYRHLTRKNRRVKKSR